MSLVYLLSPTFQFVNVSGKPLTDGYVNVYISGTRSKYYAFSDFDGSLHPFNIPLNALGSAVILVSTAHSYDIYVYNSVGTLQMSRYNITPATGEGPVTGDVLVTGTDGTVKVDTTDLPNGVQYDLSVNTDILATNESVDKVKTDLNTLTGTVDNHTTQIGQIQEDINGIDSSLAKKKDKQNELNFNGSATKTVKKITQDSNGELNVEFADINFPDYNISSSDDSINVTTSEGVTDLTLPSDVVRDSAYTHIDAATANPLMNGTASVGSSSKYAREDHVHPSDTSKEDIANKTTVILGTSDSKYPSDKAVAEFVNSSIATNTANYISNNGEPFTSVEQLEAYSGPVTNNDYAFVTGTDSEGNTYYDRYKATVNGSSVTWALEYRLNNSSFTAAQWSAINSGITSALVAKIHTHSNKAVLDGITSSDIANWNSKQNSLPTSGTASSTYAISISGNAATATATSSGYITAKDDLNSYNTANRNYICNAGNASSVTNKPSGASGAFELEVIRGTGSTCVQVYYSRDNLNFNYIRKYTGSNAWTDWVKLADSSDIKKLSSAVENNTYNIANINGILEASSSDAGKALIVNSSGNPSWSSIDSAPNISRISEFNTKSTYTKFGTNYGKDNKRSIHTFTYGTHTDNISAWIQEKDYDYGVLHYTIALNLYNSDTAFKWCVIDQGHVQDTTFHNIGKGLYVPFAQGYSYVPVDHTVVFLKSDVGSISSTISIVMGLATWSGDDINFHADDSFMVNIIHSNLTLFRW